MSNCGNQYLYVPRSARILEVEKLTDKENRYVLEFEDGKGVGRGEFVAVYALGIGEAPISLCSSPSNTKTFEIAVRRIDPPEGKHFDILSVKEVAAEFGLEVKEGEEEASFVYVQTLMNVSTYIHTKGVGDYLDIRGPYGREFPVHELKGKNVAVIVGGIGLFPGIRPLREIAENRNDFGRVWTLFGTRTPEERYFPRLLDEWTKSKIFEVEEAYERMAPGQQGTKGYVTGLLHVLESTKPEDIVVYLVGPSVMFKPVLKILKTLGIPTANIYVSLERQMRCCVGRCGHCRINDVLVCIDGPVFSLKEIKDRHLWEALGSMATIEDKLFWEAL